MTITDLCNTIIISMLNNKPVSINNSKILVTEITIDNNSIMVEGNDIESFNKNMQIILADSNKMNQLKRVNPDIIKNLKTFVNNYLRIKVLTDEVYNNKYLNLLRVEGDAYKFKVSLIKLYDINSELYKNLKLKKLSSSNISTTDKNIFEYTNTTYLRLDYTSYIVSFMLFNNIMSAIIDDVTLIDVDTNKTYEILPNSKEDKQMYEDSVTSGGKNKLPVDLQIVDMGLMFYTNITGNRMHISLNNYMPTPTIDSTKKGIYLFLNASNSSYPVTTLYKNNVDKCEILVNTSDNNVGNIVTSNPKLQTVGVTIPSNIQELSKQRVFIDNFCLDKCGYYDSILLMHKADSNLDDYILKLASKTKVIICSSCFNFIEFSRCLNNISMESLTKELNAVVDCSNGRSYKLGGISSNDLTEIDNLLQTKNIIKLDIVLNHIPLNGKLVLKDNFSQVYDKENNIVVCNVNKYNEESLKLLIDTILTKKEYQKLQENKSIAKTFNNITIHIYLINSEEIKIVAYRFEPNKTLITNFTDNMYIYADNIYDRYIALINVINHYKYLGKNILLIDDMFNLDIKDIVISNSIPSSINLYDVIISTTPIHINANTIIITDKPIVFNNKMQYTNSNINYQIFEKNIYKEIDFNEVFHNVRVDDLNIVSLVNEAVAKTPGKEY